MCTMIVTQAKIQGSGKGAGGWFSPSSVAVSYDHPFHAPFEDALNIDFVDEGQGLGDRVSVEIDVESARRLVAAIQSVLARAESAGHIDHEKSVDLIQPRTR